jgi:LysM repeat protein
LQEKASKTITILQSPTKERNKSQLNEFYSLNSDELYTLPSESSRMPIVCQAEGKGIVCKVSMPEVIKPFPLIRSVWLTHEVKKGEEIWALAKKYDTRGDLIRKLNQLSNDRIKPGMKLKLFITETL